jgi:hypothetical protein
MKTIIMRKTTSKKRAYLAPSIECFPIEVEGSIFVDSTLSSITGQSIGEIDGFKLNGGGLFSGQNTLGGQSIGDADGFKLNGGGLLNTLGGQSIGETDGYGLH